MILIVLELRITFGFAFFFIRPRGSVKFFRSLCTAHEENSWTFSWKLTRKVGKRAEPLDGRMPQEYYSLWDSFSLSRTVRDAQIRLVVSPPKASHVQLTENRSRLALMPKLEACRARRPICKTRQSLTRELPANEGSSLGTMNTATAIQKSEALVIGLVYMYISEYF